MTGTTLEGRPRLRLAQMMETDGPGGAETMLLQLTLELRRRGHFVQPVGPPDGSGWLAAQLTARGIPLETFSLRRPIDPGCYRGLRELIRRLEIDVVHSHEFTMGVYGAAAARAERKRHVITFHGGLYLVEKWRRRVAVRWAIGASAASVAVSEATRRIFSERLGISPARMGVIPNGLSIATGNRESFRNELGLRDGELLVVAVGNVMAVKGQLTLVQALAELLMIPTPWRLAIAGEERDAAPAIHALVAQRGFRDRVHMLGRRDDIPDLLAAADIFAMPSLSEGLPLALLEAMSAGRSIVASSVGGIPEVIAEGRTGMLVPPSDPVALARALRRLMDDPALRNRLGEAARRRVEEHYSIGAMADAYERLYYGLELPAAAG